MTIRRGLFIAQLALSVSVVVHCIAITSCLPSPIRLGSGGGTDFSRVEDTVNITVLNSIETRSFSLSDRIYTPRALYVARASTASTKEHDLADDLRTKREMEVHIGCDEIALRQGAGRIKHREKTKSRHTSGTRGFRGSRERLGAMMSFYHREIQSVSIEMLGHNVKATAELLFAHISDSDRDQQFYLHGEIYIFIITSINFASCPTLFRLAKCVVEQRSDLAPAAVHAVETHVLAMRIWQIEAMSQINSQEANAIRIKIEISSVKNYLYCGGGVGVVEGDGTLLATALIIAAGLYRGTCNTTGVFTDRSTGSSCTGGPAACNRRKRARQWLATIINRSVSAHWT
ncbi:hypothetical protein ALC53_11968 [Atta colombica]|uniref:Uncharacterized protein n=1 Tax=Atta colombica TaxID=520822 RepID=A0A195B005_9HYME|nr:hypothetical protein ALC53_11968 [Atta colombica]